MAGHSKWSNIKHRKGKSDAARSKLFTKIGRDIVVAVKEGGDDPDMNPQLRDAVARARAANMPNDNIERSIKRATGDLGDVVYTEFMYEGYGAGGVAVLVETMTENKNRTVGEVRHAFEKYNGSLGTTGSVSFQFLRKGVLVIDAKDKEEDTVLEDALEAGAEDFSKVEDVFEIITASGDFSDVREALEEKGYTFLSAEMDMIPSSDVHLDDEHQEEFEKMIELLEDSDDVQNVFHNALLSDEG